MNLTQSEIYLSDNNSFKPKNSDIKIMQSPEVDYSPKNKKGETSMSPVNRKSTQSTHHEQKPLALPIAIVKEKTKVERAGTAEFKHGSLTSSKNLNSPEIEELL